MTISALSAIDAEAVLVAAAKVPVTGAARVRNPTEWQCAERHPYQQRGAEQSDHCRLFRLRSCLLLIALVKAKGKT